MNSVSHRTRLVRLINTLCYTNLPWDKGGCVCGWLRADWFETKVFHNCVKEALFFCFDNGGLGRSGGEGRRGDCISFSCDTRTMFITAKYD